jgi:gamma-glutamyl hercynylcysteine S-oxide synthase
MRDKLPEKTGGQTLSEAQPVRIISDLPEKASVNFGFDAYARTLGELIASKHNKTPLVVGVYGPWGSGKTTLMEAVKQQLDGKTFADTDKFRPCKTVWFQAWKYDKEEEILAGLIEEIFKTIKKDDSIIERLKGYTEDAAVRLKVAKGVGELLKTFLGVDVSSFIADPAYRSKLGFYDTFQEFFTRLVWNYTRLRPQFDSSEEPDDTKGSLAVFIDDLDRCPQPRIVKVLETIKLFMDHQG